jgi:putative endonuclease
MFIPEKRFCVYIITNYTRKVLYTGITNNLEQRVTEHYIQRGTRKSFTGKYNVFYLVYYKYFDYVLNAIAWEKEIKDWNRKRKEALITAFNPDWKFLNEELFGKWPPDKLFHRGDRYSK